MSSYARNVDERARNHDTDRRFRPGHDNTQIWKLENKNAMAWLVFLVRRY